MNTSFSTWVFFRRNKEIGVEFIPANRANGVLREPSIGALYMKPMVATGKHPSKLLRLDVIQAHGAFRSQHQILPHGCRQFGELGGGETIFGGGFYRIIPVVVASGVAEQANVDEEDGAHASTW